MVQVKDDLLSAKEALLRSIKNEGLLTFLGAYPSENVPQIRWNSELEPDPSNFVSVAKSLGAKVLYVNWVTFTEDQLNEARVEESGEDNDGNERAFSANEQNKKVEQFARYVGSVASVRSGFFLDGVFHVFEREATWYEEFGVLIGFEESEENSESAFESGRESKLSKEALAWAEKLANDPKFVSLKDWSQQCYLLRKLAGDDYENLPVDAIVRQAEAIFEVDLRPSEEKKVLERIQELRNQGKTILAIAGKLGIPRERVSMLLAKLES